MKFEYQQPLKEFIRDQITQTVKEKNLTTDKAADILDIDTRTFAYMKSGKTMCSATTLMVFLVKLCPEPVQFLNDAKKIIDEIEQTHDL